MTLKPKRLAVGSDQPVKAPVKSGSEPDATLVSYKPQQLLRRLDADLEQLSRGVVYTGETGDLALRILKKVEGFITTYEENVKELLERQPHAIPGWRLETQNRRSLSRDTVKVYEALAGVVELSPEDFLPACAPSISGATKLLETQGGMEAEEANHVIEHALGDCGLLSHEIVHRLVRDKEGPSHE
jgi:hypothetical protein